MPLRVVTVPGPWDNQAPEEFVKLSAKLPFIEWGIKYDGGHQIGRVEYPTREWIRQLAWVSNPDTRIALHLHGAHGRDFLIGELPSKAELGEDTWKKFRRIHIPVGDLLTDDPEMSIDIPQMMDMIGSEWFQDHPQGFRCVTFQVSTPESDRLVWEICEYIDDAYPMFDSRGKVFPKKWTEPYFPKTSDGMSRGHGYAADFTKENFYDSLREINTINADRPYWVTLDSSVKLNGEIGFGRIKEIAEPVSPLYKSGCCRETGSPVRAEYIRVDTLEREWDGEDDN